MKDGEVQGILASGYDSFDGRPGDGRASAASLSAVPHPAAEDSPALGGGGGEYVERRCIALPISGKLLACSSRLAMPCRSVPPGLATSRLQPSSRLAKSYRSVPPGLALRALPPQTGVGGMAEASKIRTPSNGTHEKHSNTSGILASSTTRIEIPCVLIK